MSWISVRIRIVPTKNGAKASADDTHRLIDQIKNDALYGTYAELDGDYWKSRMDRTPDSLAEAEMTGGPEPADGGLDAYEFELRLASDLFPPQMGGAQHLYGILAGDLLRFTLPPFGLQDWRIKDIQFPTEWDDAHFSFFRRDIANDIRGIRSAFNLTEGMPLLAFSFKPRVGFTLESLEEIAYGVLSAGFNVVELDTRHLPLDKSMLDDLIKIACNLPDKIKKHVGRLSLNLSFPTHLVIDAVDRICKDCYKPVILKIDGGFNGLSSIQSVRSMRIKDGRKLGPILTCYPLLHSTLARYIPNDHYIRTLAASGVDIIYPGGKPDIGAMTRSLDGAGADDQVRAVRRYHNLSKEGWPMLSVAGGVYPGQLQAFYELLGPNVAWYLGGGVALHKDGPSAGASMCVRVAREARDRRQSAGKDWAEDLSQKLSEQCDEMFKNRSALTSEQLRYVSPKKHLSKIYGLAPYKP